MSVREVTLTQAMMDAQKNTWSVRALAEGASIHAVFADGRRCGPNEYNVDAKTGDLAWNSTPVPKEVRVQLEDNKSTKSAPRLAIIVPAVAVVLAALVGGYFQYLAARTKDPYPPTTSASASGSAPSVPTPQTVISVTATASVSGTGHTVVQGVNNTSGGK